MKKIKVNKTKLILGIMLGSLIGLLFGISYAGFSYLRNGTTSNYTSLNSNYFLGLKFVNNQVTNAYACGIYNYGSENEQPFCIEGWSDASKQSTNMGIITPIFGSGNCDSDICTLSGVLEAVAGSYGDVDVCSLGTNKTCFVVDDGGFRCNY